MEQVEGMRAQSGSSEEPHRHNIPILSSRFQYAARRPLLFGKATLYGDRIELIGWHWLDRIHQTIPLDRILQFDYHPLRGGGNLTLYLEGGEVLRLRMKQAHRWREQFEHWLRYDVHAPGKLMNLEDPNQAASQSG